MIVPSTSALAATRVTIDLNDTHQEIDGFGVAFPWMAYYLKHFDEQGTGRDEILDLLFSQTKGAGFSIVRNMINCEPDPTAMPDDDPPDWTTIEPSEGQWDFTHDDDQIWVMHEAQQRGVTRFVSSVWSPPPWMKDKNDCDNGGSLRPEAYGAFATYLSTYVRKYKELHGIDIYAVSPSNEPELPNATTPIPYDSANWTGTQLQDFIKNYLTPTFHADGVTAKVMMPESGSWNETAMITETLQDPEASAGVDIVAAHAYAGTPTPFTLSKAQNKRVWQTETSSTLPDDTTITDTLHWAKQIHSYMVDAEANSWFWWWGAIVAQNPNTPLSPSLRSRLVPRVQRGIAPHLAPAPATNSGQGLIYFKWVDDPAQNTVYSVRKRLYGIANYSRFVRPGFVRVGTTPAPPDVYISAYKDPATQELVIVAINDSDGTKSIHFSLPQIKQASVKPFRTSAVRNLSALSSLSVRNHGLALGLPRRSITTLMVTPEDDR